MRYSAATSSPSEVSVGANGLMVAAELGSALAAGTSVPALLEMLKGQASPEDSIHIRAVSVAE